MLNITDVIWHIGRMAKRKLVDRKGNSAEDYKEVSDMRARLDVDIFHTMCEVRFELYDQLRRPSRRRVNA